MRTLRGMFEGLLDSDFDGVDIEAMPKVGQAIIDLWSGIKKKKGTVQYWAHHDEAWMMDYDESYDTMITTYKTLQTINKNHVGKKYAQNLMQTGDGDPDADVCLICLAGNNPATYTLGIGRPSTHDGLFFQADVGSYNRDASGLIWDTSLRNKSLAGRNISQYIEGSINPRVWRKFWLIPGYCFDVIKRKIIK